MCSYIAMGLQQLKMPYTASKDLLAFQQAGGYEAGFHDTDFFSYVVESTKRFALGDEVTFRHKKMTVTEVKARLDRGHGQIMKQIKSV